MPDNARLTAVSASADKPEIVPGAILLDRYKAVRVVGQGGMGVVVHAVHLIEGDEVAIKFLLPQFATSAEAGARFVREARAAAKIPSDHITRVMDTGTSPDFGAYIVMEFLPGDDLSRHVRRGLRATVDVAIDYIVQAADALAHAHTVGVIHRDVKPANMFLIQQPGQRAVVKVLDFGISKVVEEASLEITKTSTLLGSGLYMSPEQMRSAKTVDHRTDVYSLGISMFELLTGTQPFVADSYPDLCIKVTMEEPAPLRRFRPDIPEDLARVIGRAYARLPAERYQSVPEFATALSPWAAPDTRPAILALEKLGRSRPPMASGDFQSVPPPPPAAKAFDNAATLPVAPILPQILMGGEVLGGPPGARPGSSPELAEARTQAMGPAPATRGSSVPPGPPLIETSAKAFSKTASTDSAARTIAIAALGTFFLCTLLVGGYLLSRKSHPAGVDGPDPTAAVDPKTVETVAARSTNETPPVAPTQTASSEATDDPSASASASTASSASAKTPRVPKTPASASASAKPRATGSPGDPFSCFDPTTKLRIPCPAH